MKREASKHLRLAPAVHGNIVPAEEQTAGTEGAVGLDPVLQNSSNNGIERCFQLRKTIAQQQTQIDALSAIVELAFVNGQARRFGKRLGESILGKEILQVIIHTFGKRPEARLISGQREN